jgi:hypothetical protein
MKFLFTAAMVTVLTGCGSNSTEQKAPKAILAEAKIIKLNNARAFILPALRETGVKKWVWFAPSFLSGIAPNNEQHGYYFTSLREAGFSIVGVDVGESFGSPNGRESFLSFWNYLKGEGYEDSGCFLLQSRGGLMGYTFLKEHPEAAKCVVGIYPLLSFSDYLGPVHFSVAWGLSLSDFISVSATDEPLANAAAFPFPIMHLHGTTDAKTSWTIDKAFTDGAPAANLITITGQGHESYSPEFFASASVLSFILLNGNEED